MRRRSLLDGSLADATAMRATAIEAGLQLASGLAKGLSGRDEMLAPVA